MTVVASLNMIGMPPISAGTPSQSWSFNPMTTRTSGNSALRSVRAMSWKYLSSTEPGRSLTWRVWRSARLCVVSDRHQQDDVVIDLDLGRAPAPAKPYGNFDGFPMLAAAEEQHFAVVVARRVDHETEPAHARGGRWSISSCGISMKLALCNTAPERIDQVAIGPLDGGGIGAAMGAVDLGTEIEVVVAQLLEPVKILVVVDRSEQLAELAEFLPVRLAG